MLVGPKYACEDAMEGRHDLFPWKLELLSCYVIYNELVKIRTKFRC